MGKKEMDMIHGNLLKKIIIFTIPVLLSGVLQLLYNACDLIVVGKFAGDDSLAAVGSTSSLTNLIVNLFMGISIGASVVVANAVGKQDMQKAQNATHTAVLISLIVGAFLMVFGIFTARIWLELMDTTPEALDKATLYLQIYFGGMIFNMLYNFEAAILRAVGETKKPLYILGFSGLFNVALNLLLVIVFNMNVAGVAIATIFAQAISAVLITICLIKKTGYVHLNLKKLKIHGRSLWEMVLVGLPAGVQASLFSISNVVIQSAVNSFGSTLVVAGNTASSNIEGFVWVSMNSFYQACITFTSQNYGAGNLKRCKKVLILCLSSVVVVGIVLGSIAYLLHDILLGLYTDGREAIGYGTIRLGIICLTYFTCGMMDVLVGGLRGLGKSIIPMIVSIVGVCVFRIVWIYTIFENNHTLTNLYISYPISWVLTGAVHLLSYMIVYKKILKKQKVDVALT